VVYLAALVAFAAVIVATWLGSDDNNKPKPAVTKPHNGPTFRVVGNGGKCSLGTGRTFHFEGRGFTPGGKVIVLVFAPQNYRDPVYSNPYRFYWFHENFGVYQADANGEVHTKSAPSSFIFELLFSFAFSGIRIRSYRFLCP
jgi:hypothetical protein